MTEEKLVSMGVKIDENVKIIAELSTQVNNLIQGENCFAELDNNRSRGAASNPKIQNREDP